MAGLIFGSLFVTCANAQETTKDEATSDNEAVLFRIENIAPIANKDGLTDKCSYIMTVFNRTDKALRAADLKLEWVDSISRKYQIENGQISVAEGGRAETRVIKDVSIDNVAPHTQKSFEQTVDTDKCFLLLDNLSFNVVSCQMEGDTVQYKDGQAAKGLSCGVSFNYIDSKNPEYYSEFKDVPESVLAKQVQEEKERELSKVNDTVSSIMTTLDKTDQELEKIK